MFQPQPTPYSQFFTTPYGLHVANAGLPDYTFAATPQLGQFGGGRAGGNTAGSTHSEAGVVGANEGAFHASAASNGRAGVDVRVGVGVQVQGPGSPTPVAPGSYSTNSASNAHYHYNTPMSVSAPRHRPNNQHRQPQHRNQHQNQQPQQQQPLLHQQHPLRPRPTHIQDQNISPYKMDQSLGLDQSEIAQQEAAARDYDPQFKGPLVGEKMSSQAITEEYARADPTYVTKTLALPQTYSHYRPIQGDGNCGYRAIAFAYFETIVKCGDISLVRSELDRLTLLNKYIEDVGGQEPGMLELMVSDTIDLFTEIIPAMSTGNDAMSILLEKFNDPNTSQCLVYHLRLLACAQLKGNRDEYEPYLGTDVETYLNTTVMPVNREIDHICVALVHACLLRPVNIVLEIAYLDRSEGTKVNVHRFPEEANGQDLSTLGPVIHLLYRPGHYDILYREAQVHAPLVPAAPVELQINRVTSFVHNNPPEFEDQVPALQNADFNMNMSILAMIPGLESSSFGPPSTTPSPMTNPYTPSPASSWVPQQVMPAPPASHPSPPQPRPTEHPLRFSKYSYNFPSLPEMAGGNSNTLNEPSFTTNTFKNSHFNTAHYNNQNFQPEMYQPDAEEEASSGGNSKNGVRKRSTDSSSGIKKEK
ncbi:hypothetical protein ANO14919_140820 [Xylariales sp. No.14919]|nr:hypothetical protein ANO14919_140820 [Xylariales sp. No.14919]